MFNQLALTLLNHFSRGRTYSTSSMPWSETYQILKLKLGPQANKGTERRALKDNHIPQRGEAAALQKKISHLCSSLSLWIDIYQYCPANKADTLLIQENIQSQFVATPFGDTVIF